jgi:hypothetical protein
MAYHQFHTGICENYKQLGIRRSIHKHTSNSSKYERILHIRPNMQRIEKQDWKFLLEQRFRLIEKSTSCETAFNILAKLGLEVSHKKLTTLLTNRITAKVMVEMHDAILSDNTTKFCKLCQHFPHFITDHIVISQNNGFWCKNSLILPRMTPQSSFKIPCDSVFVCARNIEVEETQTILTFIKEHNKSQKLRKLVQTGPNKNLRPKPKLKIQ